MDENKEFDERIQNINYFSKQLVDYFDWYFSVERTFINQKDIWCGDVFVTLNTCRNYTNLILLIKYLDIPELQWLVEHDLTNKLVYFHNTLNESLDKSTKEDESVKICVDTEQREALYLLYCFYITLSDETFNNNYLGRLS
ncbi:MAG: hypothetical protein IIT97_02015, partial [Mycoplasmataceae bacterium]|nr:hypothetical protein [Mycoplasmataceae bacterium]